MQFSITLEPTQESYIAYRAERLGLKPTAYFRLIIAKWFIQEGPPVILTDVGADSYSKFLGIAPSHPSDTVQPFHSSPGPEKPKDGTKQAQGGGI